MNECECGFARTSVRESASVSVSIKYRVSVSVSACVFVYVCVYVCVSVCVTYGFWCAGGLRVVDIYANHFVVLDVILDQDVQVRTAGTARVSNQIR